MQVKPYHRFTSSFRLRPLALAIFTLLSASSLPLYAAGSINLLGDLEGGESASFALAVSADGSVVVGQSASSNGYETIRWTQAGGLEGLGDLPAEFVDSIASDVNADGSVMVGQSNSNGQAFRWTRASGMVSLGDFSAGIFGSYASGVNADGSVVVGQRFTSGSYEAFRWTQAGGMVGLGDLAGVSFNRSSASAVNADGSVVVGESSSPNGFEAFRWTQAGGMVGLGDLAGGIFNSVASDVNADGSIVVGRSESANGPEAFLWTQSGGMVGLGDLAGGSFISDALAVNADGSVVVGMSNTSDEFSFEAFRWTQASGMVTVASWLAAAGVVVPYQLNSATDVSADGLVVVGQSRGGAYIARVSSIGSGIINPAVFNQTVIETGSRALQTGVGLPSIVLFGAHHRTILDNGLVRSAENNGCAWATGDFGRNNESDTKMGVAEMGICKDLGSARIGLGFGLDWAKQDLSLGGKADYDGQHILIEAANAFENGLQPSVLAYYGRFDTTINRRYQNGAAVDNSRGSPDASSKAIRLRLDWKDMAQLGNVSLSPYAAYTWMRTSLDGYTETGGGFPVQYNSNSWTTNDIRLGAATTFAASTATNIRVGAEAVHRFEDNTASGQVLGLGGFNFEGKGIKQTWVRATADLDHRFSDDMLVTVGVNAGTGGSDANFGLTAGLRANF